MAADQRRKRLNASSSVGCTSWEKYRAKTKKLGLPQDDLNMQSSISLEWDGKNKCVVAKREQIGISRGDLVPLVGILPHCYRNLADVFSVPCEIFELENLVGILSYEVWQTQLSEYQRNILMQFLPKGVEPDNVVQELLGGDNFNFGNPFLKWGASVCSGKLHPDNVLHREQSINAYKNAYHIELQRYHTDMIENLQLWKERWEACPDSEEEIVQKIWRLTKQAGKDVKFAESDYCDPVDNEIATPGSCSWVASEKACSNDNNLSMAVVPGESQRSCRKDISDGKVYNSLDGLKAAVELKKGEQLNKRIIQCGDGAKYMSYIKVSKEQHQRVKSTMKHNSCSIQPRLLNNVLGSLDAFQVQPLEIFEKEERQKLHNYWLQLANTDIPVCFANWSGRKLEKLQLTKSLCKEIEENLKFQEQLVVDDVEKDNPHGIHSEQIDNGAAEVSPVSAEEVEEREYSDTLLQDQMASQMAEDTAIAVENDNRENTGYVILGQAHKVRVNVEEDDTSVSISTEDQHLGKIGPISSVHQVNAMIMDFHDTNVIARANDLPPIMSEHLGNINQVGTPVSRAGPHGLANDVWLSVSVPASYYHSASLSHGYVSSSELSLAHPQIMEEQPTEVIDLDVCTQGKASGRELLHRQSDDLSLYSYPNQGQSELRRKDTGKDMLRRQVEDVSFFSNYLTQDRNEIFESFFKGQSALAYDHEQRRMGLDFQQSDNLMMETGQFSGHFRDPADISHPEDIGQKRINDIYIDQDIQESVYSDEGRYSVPRHLPVNNIQDWGGGNTRMLSHSQSDPNGEDLGSRNWFPVENQGRSDWSGLEGAVGPKQSIGSENHSDQSLFSVLSECNKLRSRASYDSIGSVARFMQPVANSRLGEGFPGTSNILQQTANSLNYLGRQQEATVGLKVNNLGWMGMSHQNSGLQESMNKPFV